MKKGWIVKSLGEACIITMGQSPKGTSYNDSGNGLPLVNGPVEFGKGVDREKFPLPEAMDLPRTKTALQLVEGEIWLPTQALEKLGESDVSADSLIV